MKKHKSVFSNVLQLIGDTPLVKLNNITSSFKGNFYAKLESFNPCPKLMERRKVRSF